MVYTQLNTICDRSQGLKKQVRDRRWTVCAFIRVAPRLWAGEPEEEAPGFHKIFLRIIFISLLSPLTRIPLFLFPFSSQIPRATVDNKVTECKCFKGAHPYSRETVRAGRQIWSEQQNLGTALAIG